MSAAHVAENSGFLKTCQKRYEEPGHQLRWQPLDILPPSIQRIASQRRLFAERLTAKPKAASNSKMTLVGSGRRDHCRRRIRRANSRYPKR